MMCLRSTWLPRHRAGAPADSRRTPPRPGTSILPLHPEGSQLLFFSNFPGPAAAPRARRRDPLASFHAGAGYESPTRNCPRGDGCKPAGEARAASANSGARDVKLVHQVTVAAEKGRPTYLVPQLAEPPGARRPSQPTRARWCGGGRRAAAACASAVPRGPGEGRAAGGAGTRRRSQPGPAPTPALRRTPPPTPAPRPARPAGPRPQRHCPAGLRPRPRPRPAGSAVAKLWAPPALGSARLRAAARQGGGHRVAAGGSRARTAGRAARG